MTLQFLYFINSICYTERLKYILAKGALYQIKGYLFAGFREGPLAMGRWTGGPVRHCVYSLNKEKSNAEWVVLYV